MIVLVKINTFRVKIIHVHTIEIPHVHSIEVSHVNLWWFFFLLRWVNFLFEIQRLYLERGLQVLGHSIGVSLWVGKWESSVHGSHVKQQPCSIFGLFGNDKFIGTFLFFQWWAIIKQLDNEGMARVQLEDLQRKTCR